MPQRQYYPSWQEPELRKKGKDEEVEEGGNMYNRVGLILNGKHFGTSPLRKRLKHKYMLQKGLIPTYGGHRRLDCWVPKDSENEPEQSWTHLIPKANLGTKRHIF